jgi:hypothetical protein
VAAKTNTRQGDMPERVFFPDFAVFVLRPRAGWLSALPSGMDPLAKTRYGFEFTDSLKVM